MANPDNEATMQELREQLATLRADVARLSGTAAEGVKGNVDAAGRQVARSGRDAREGVADAVTEHPLTAIGVAAGVGYLLGVLTRR
ncbi:MAG: hypothetical protein R6V44_06785 [Paracoccaceae bacterium]